MMQVLGLCRFSLLVTGGFKRAPADLEARAAHLFDPRRLALRFAWFESLLLPCLDAQTDRDFRFVVLASDALPEPWRGRLEALIAGRPQVELEFAPPGEHHRIGNAAIARRIHPRAEVVAQFRIDDDDAVARDYVARLRQDHDDYLRPFLVLYGAVALDHTHGVVVDADASGCRLVGCREQGWNCAQALFHVGSATPPLLLNHGHHRLHAWFPTVTLGDSLMYLRGRHGSNDSAFPVPKLQTTAVDPQTVMDRFGVSTDALVEALRGASA